MKQPRHSGPAISHNLMSKNDTKVKSSSHVFDVSHAAIQAFLSHVGPRGNLQVLFKSNPFKASRNEIEMMERVRTGTPAREKKRERERKRMHLRGQIQQIKHVRAKTATLCLSALIRIHIYPRKFRKEARRLAPIVAAPTPYSTVLLLPTNCIVFSGGARLLHSKIPTPARPNEWANNNSSTSSAAAEPENFVYTRSGLHALSHYWYFVHGLMTQTPDWIMHLAVSRLVIMHRVNINPPAR